MIIKLIGAMLVLCGCSVFGIMSASSYRKEIKILGSFIDLINGIECDLQYKANKLQDVFEDLADSVPSPMSDFCRILSAEFNSQVQPRVPDCVYAALAKCRNIPKSTQCYIVKLGLTLGRYDLNGQLLELCALKKATELAIEKLSFQLDTKTRNMRTFAICAGAAIVILFI